MKYTKLRTVALTLLILCSAVCLLLAAACADNGGNVTDSGTATITYETGVEGVTIAELTAKTGSKIYPPADPEREGYRFEGWSLDGEIFTFDVMPSNNITLKAVWTKLYSVTFNTGDGATVIPSAIYAEGETVEMPEPPVRAHFKFLGWSLDGNGDYINGGFGAMPARDVVLTAVWTEAVTITFNTNVSGFTVAPILEKAGTKITAPQVNRAGWYLLRWELNGKEYVFDTMPDSDITLSAVWQELTNLPAMFIDLFDENGNTLPIGSVVRDQDVASGDASVDSVISLANTDDNYLINSVTAKFKGRGNGSWTDTGDKKGYKIKFDKKQSLFGHAANKHWVIIACTNFDDGTLSRNYLAYNMARDVFSEIEYTTSAQWIDVYVNGEYRGVYLLCEHVRVGDGRVDIVSEYGVEDTGYLVEYDAYATGEEGVDYFRVDGLKYPFTVKSPDPEEYLSDGGISKAAFMRQVAYIKDYVSKVYSAALNNDYNTFSELADSASFVDMYILHELFKNTDAGYSSFFLYKKAGGKLYAGPAWDFDATANGATDRGDRSPQGIYVADAIQTGSPHTASELFISLYKNDAFKRDVKARWKQLSPRITEFLDERLNDAVYEEYKTAMGKNFVRWNGKTQTAAENDWVNDVKTLKQWLVDRITWLNTEWA